MQMTGGHTRNNNEDKSNPFRKQQQALIENFLKPAGVTDKHVLKAFLKVPRHEFVLPEHKNDAYMDIPLPIGEGQTISQPSLVAVMTQALKLKGDEKVLEIGTGSGFQAAILSKLAKTIYTVEIIDSLAQKANVALAKLGCKNVHVIVGNGSMGLAQFAPYDAIIVTAAAGNVPKPLIEQLKDSGRIVIPIGTTSFDQELNIGQKIGKSIQFVNIGPVMFVPLHEKLDLKEIKKVEKAQEFNK